ncbi:hypothetical protein FB451DRAFT_1148878 [Mycena latifolia]|nr:hypothetical protein FB451DRAFT_1148878 [Mycena latifolia]
MSLPAEATFPEDLERLIFEIASFSYPGVMPTLLLVAQRVKIWIEPLLYMVLYNGSVQSGKGRTLLQLRNLIRSRPSSVFQDYVRHVYLSGFDEHVTVVDILSACPSTTDLKLLPFWGRGPELLPILGAMPLQRLALHLGLIFTASEAPVDFAHPLFLRITHLELGGWPNDDEGWAAWAGLAQLPALTHLAFHNNLVLPPVCQSALAQCPSLAALVIVCSDQDAVERYAPDYADVATDPRFVMVVVLDELRDWERGARGGDDYWVAADALIRRRRAGETKEYGTKSAMNF